MSFLKATHTISKEARAGHSQKPPRAGEQMDPAPYQGRRGHYFCSSGSLAGAARQCATEDLRHSS